MRRLFKRFSVIGVLLALMMIALVAGPAAADEDFTNTCGSSGGVTGVHGATITLTYFYGDASGGHWGVTWEAECGNGGTMEWEIQKSTDGGNTWHDIAQASSGDIDYQVASPINGTKTYSKTPTSNAYCVSTASYRARIWDADGGPTGGTGQHC